jgi:sortase A
MTNRLETRDIEERKRAMTIAADRGGPFVRDPRTARNWMRAAAPGIAYRFPADESSPIGGRPSSPSAARANAIHFHRTIAMLCIILLGAAGAASLGRGLYIYAKAQLAQVLLHAAWVRAQESGSAAKPWPWADTHPVARLHAPAQDADVLILAGASGRTLAFGPGHLDGSAQPGDPGNAVITAHRDTHFRFLHAVTVGDALFVERADGGKRHFRIRRSYVVDYRDLHLARDTAVPTLTLVTCFPFGALNPGGPLRYVVVAEAA